MPSPDRLHEIARSSRVGELVGRHEPRPGRAEAGERLAEAELRRRALQLRDALGEVLADREAGDVIPRALAVDLVRLAADHDDELDLPVDVPFGQLDHGVGSDDRRRELRERHRHRIRRVAGLGRVLGVVQADREHLARARHGGAELGRRRRTRMPRHPPSREPSPTRANAAQSSNSACGSGPKRPSDARGDVDRAVLALTRTARPPRLAILTSRPAAGPARRSALPSR